MEIGTYLRMHGHSHIAEHRLGTWRLEKDFFAALRKREGEK